MSTTEDQCDNFTNDSAMMIAWERHLEGIRDDALFHDPFAKSLAGSKGEKLSADFGANCAMFEFPDWPEFHRTWTAVRTKFIDDRIKEFADSGKITQLINLGAGLDTRPYRLESYKIFSGGNFDFDMEVMNSNKRIVFEKFLHAPRAHCPTSDININFLNDGKTIATELDAAAHVAGCKCTFDKSKPSVIICEGLIMYLGKVGKEKIIKDLSAVAAPGSVLVLQYLDGSESETAKNIPGALDNALSRAEATQFLRAGGWDTDTLKFYRFGEEKLNYGRFPLDKFSPTAGFSFLVCHKA